MQTRSAGEEAATARRSHAAGGRGAAQGPSRAPGRLSGARLAGAEATLGGEEGRLGCAGKECPAQPSPLCPTAWARRGGHKEGRAAARTAATACQPYRCAACSSSAAAALLNRRQGSVPQRPLPVLLPLLLVGSLRARALRAAWVVQPPRVFLRTPVERLGRADANVVLQLGSPCPGRPPLATQSPSKPASSSHLL